MLNLLYIGKLNLAFLFIIYYISYLNITVFIFINNKINHQTH